MKNIHPPANAEIIKGEIADYWYAPDGILYSYSKNPVRTVRNITENIALVKSVTNNKIVPLLIYLSNSPVPEKQRDSSRQSNCRRFILQWQWFQNRDFQNSL